jgi:hypothetical protein
MFFIDVALNFLNYLINIISGKKFFAINSCGFGFALYIFSVIPNRDMQVHIILSTEQVIACRALIVLVLFDTFAHLFSFP